MLEREPVTTHPIAVARSILRPALSLVLAAVVAVVLLCPPAYAAGGVQPAFDALVRSLEAPQVRGSGRPAVEDAARRLKVAIQADGGAREGLMAVTRNIVVSLRDGSFSAEASLRALRGIAPRTVLDPGPWRSSAPYPEPVGLSLHQKGEGDCVGISALKAFSTTHAGETILRRAVSRDPAGGFAVNLPGAPSRVFHLRDGDLDQYGIGDPAGAAIIGALFQYFGLDPHHAALPTNKVMELLAGNLGRHARLADAKSSAADIERFLLGNAPMVGAKVAMVFGGKPAHGGDWSRGDGHAFAVLRIDAASRTVFYTNPWNEGKVHTIAISDLAAQASGTSADFETVSF